jgi:hypothetical protein
MHRWPWITVLMAVALAVFPVGQNFIYLAFFSGEQLSRNIAQPIVFTALAVVVLLVALEWWVRRIMHKRRLEN